MKKVSYLLVVLSMLFGTSCTNDFEQEMNDGKFSFNSISASMGDLPTTRTHLENGGKVVWDLNDAIGVWSDETVSPIQFLCTYVDESKAIFSENEVSGNQFYACHPFFHDQDMFSVNDDIVSYFLSGHVSYSRGVTCFDRAPLIAKSNSNEFQFKHTCGFIRFSLTGTQTIKTLTLEGNNNEIIAGPGTIDLSKETPIFIPNSDNYTTQVIEVNDLQLSSDVPTDFYFAVPVGTFSKGLSLTIEYLKDNSSVSTIKKITTKEVSISRSVIKSFTVFDADELIEESGEEKIYNALMAFYNATDGENWYNNTNWGSNEPFEEWYGINTISYGGYDIRSISLSENNLRGSISEDMIPFLASLKDLEGLFLDSNNLEGDISFIGNLSTSLEMIDLQQNKFSGTIPTEIGNLINLWSLNLDYNSISGTLPNSLGNLKNLESLYIQHTDLEGEIPSSIINLKKITRVCLANNNFSGGIPEELAQLPLLKYLHLGWNNLSGTIPTVLGDCLALEELHLNDNNLGGNIPEELGEIRTLKELNLNNNQLEGEIPENLINLSKLESLALSSNDLIGTLPNDFVSLTNLKRLYLQQNKLNGVCSVEMTEFIEALEDYNITQQNGYELKFNFYQSTDFSKDGIVQKLQTHSKGNGINFIITMDGFSDRQIDNGIVNTYVQEAYEALFSEEPYTTFKNYFNVYVVLTVSEREKINNGTALETTYNDSRYSLNYEKIESYAKKIEGFDVNIPNNTHILVLLNDKGYYRANCAYLSYGSIACTSIRTEDDDMGETIRHEVLGHGVGNLEDEYIEESEPGVETENPYAGSFPQTSWQNIWNGHANGWGLNVDVTNDPTKIVWKDFLNNDDYKVENIGIYEGALLYAKGAYRPTEQSIMRHNVGGFNAPSRWAIYKHILEAAGETPTFEAFLEYDKKNLTSTRSILLDNTSDEPIDKRKLGVPPIFLNR